MELHESIFILLLFVPKLKSIKVLIFFEKNVEKKHLHHPDKNYYYFYKLNIPVINLIVASRNMVKVLKNMSL